MSYTNATDKLKDSIKSVFNVFNDNNIKTVYNYTIDDIATREINTEYVCYISYNGIAPTRVTEDGVTVVSFVEQISVIMKFHHKDNIETNCYKILKDMNGIMFEQSYDGETLPRFYKLEGINPLTYDVNKNFIEITYLAI